MSHIKSCIDELDSLKKQIKLNNFENAKRNRPIRERVDTLNNTIQNYLKEKNLPGIKYNGKVVLVKTEDKKPLKSKIDRKNSVIKELRSFGVKDPDLAYERLDNAQRKDAVKVNNVVIESIK